MSIRGRAVRAASHVRGRRPSRLVEPLVAVLRAEGLPLDDGTVVVLVDASDDGVGAALAGHIPTATVVTCAPGDAMTTLRASARPRAIIDATIGGKRHKLFRETVWALVDGGLYVAVAAGRQWQDETRVVGEPDEARTAAANKRFRELGESTELLETAVVGLSVVRKRGTHHVTLRHAAVEQTMAARFGAEWGEVMARREAYEFESRATLVMHGTPTNRIKQTTIAVPALALRRYADATCHVRDISTRDNLVLPDSFRHWNGSRLFHKRIHQASSWFGRLDEAISGAPPRLETGEFFTFDSAFPVHFGHLTTETISRHWGWRIAKERNRDLRVVMTHQPGKDRLPRYKAKILEALGVPTDDILWVTEGESVTVESLVAAMPQMENPHYIDQGIAETWEALYAGLGPDPVGGRPKKIFLSRRARTQRSCTNAPEVEAFMVEQGFVVIFPEDMSYAEQAHTFRAARVVAGFAGSALFNTMFSPHAKVVVLTSQSYVAANEYLIASVGGNEIHYFWSPARVTQPDGGFSVDAYRSAFTFPLQQHRAALVDALA